MMSRSFKVGRFTAGFLAGVVAAPLTAVAAVVDVRVTRHLHWEIMSGLFLGITGGILWLGEEYGLIADAYRSSKDDPLSIK